MKYFYIIIILLLLLLICICKKNKYEYFDDNNESNFRCYGGDQNGAICHIDNKECVNISNRTDVYCKYVTDNYYCYTLDNKPLYNYNEETKENELIRCSSNTKDDMDCPNGMCKKCSDNLSDLDGKCGLYDNGCGYPCLYGTELDRSSNGSTEYVNIDGDILYDNTGIPTQQGCCSEIKLCGIGKQGSELDPCYPNGYCVKCSDMPISWLPDLKISMEILNNSYKFIIENNRINDVIFLIPYTIEEGIIRELLPYNMGQQCTEEEWNTCNWSNNEFPTSNENTTNLIYNINEGDIDIIQGFIVQLIRLDHYNDNMKPYKLGIENSNIGLAGVKQWQIPLTVNINDINKIQGDIIKEQLLEERTCSEEFDGIPLNNEPTSNYQCICNTRYLTNKNLEDWLPPYGAPILKNNDNPDSISKLDNIFNKFYHISDDENNRSILNDITNQRRTINNWELRNKCKLLDESVQDLGSSVSRLSQDYDKIDELWEEGKWNPEEKAGGEHINTMDNDDIPTI